MTFDDLIFCLTQAQAGGRVACSLGGVVVASDNHTHPSFSKSWLVSAASVRSGLGSRLNGAEQVTRAILSTLSLLFLFFLSPLCAGFSAAHVVSWHSVVFSSGVFCWWSW